ncbi:DUF4430 domain-containing protein [Caproiciproducens sp. LBM24188]
MKQKISALVCAAVILACLFSGCKVELPAQHNSVSSATSSKAATASSSAAKPKSSASKTASVPQAKQAACTFSISAAEILKNKDQFTEAQLSIVPKDGVLYPANQVQITEGETVFAILLRVAKSANLAVTHVSSALGTEYVQSIGGIAQKQYGNNSGWTYLVNGKLAPVACNDYKLKSGDTVEWIFVCSNS